MNGIFGRLDRCYLSTHKRIMEVLSECQNLSPDDKAGRFLLQHHLWPDFISEDFHFHPASRIPGYSKKYPAIILTFRNNYNKISAIRVYPLITKSSRLHIKMGIQVIAEDVSNEGEACRLFCESETLTLTLRLEDALALRQHRDHYSTWVISSLDSIDKLHVPYAIKDIRLCVSDDSIDSATTISTATSIAKRAISHSCSIEVMPADGMSFHEYLTVCSLHGL